VEDSIVIALREVRAKAPNAKVVLMGYPKLLEGYGGCVLGIGAGEAPWLNSMSTLLAQHMAEAADRANAAAGTQYVRFADPTSAFAGRAVCGDPENIHGIVAPWNRTPGEKSSLVEPSQQSFHPKIAGQQNYADTLNAALSGWGS
jgi:hypothetical protein